MTNADTECPTPGKTRHPTKWQAQNAMRRFWRTGSPGKKMPNRVYKCRCGAWHMTSLPLKRGSK